MGNYKDHTMEQLANKGNGNNYYIDSISEARKSLPSRPGQADRLEFIRLMGGEEGEAGGFLATGGSEPRQQRAISTHGFVVAGAVFGGLVVRGESSDGHGMSSGLRIGYGRGATDISVQLSGSRIGGVSSASNPNGKTANGEAMDVYSVSAALSHRFFSGSRIHPIGGFGIESLVMAPSVGDRHLAFAALGRMGVEVTHPTSRGELALGFDATAHLPLGQSSRGSMEIDSLVNIGTYLDLRF